MKLLEIAMETYFKTKDGRIYFQTDGTPIGKSILGPLAGMFMNWFEKTFVFNNPRFNFTLEKEVSKRLPFLDMDISYYQKRGYQIDHKGIQETDTYPTEHPLEK